MFGSNFDDFSRPRTIGARKVKNGPGWLGFDTRNVRTVFGTYVLSFPILTTENGLRQIFTTFSGPGTTGLEKLKRGPRWLGLVPETYLTFWDAVLIVSYQYGKKMFRSNFDDFSRPGYHRSSESWKSGPDDYISHPKPTDAVCGVVSIVSRQYGWKIIRSSFDDFSVATVPSE